MKRLKQENDQLKKALADAGGEVPAVPAEASAPPVVDAAPVEEPEAVEASAPPVEDVAIEEPVIEEPAAEAPAEPVEAAAAEGDDKSPEDLLSEFEKMLG